MVFEVNCMRPTRQCSKATGIGKMMRINNEDETIQRRMSQNSTQTRNHDT